MPAFPTLPANLPTLVAKAYAAALAAGDVIFTSSAATRDLRINDVVYRARFCPSLQHKPTPTPQTFSSSSSQPKAKANPFLPPQRGLLIASIPDYNLILNRYPIIPQHFLLCTATFEPQTEPLRPQDLAAVYAVLRTWEDVSTGERLYGFFNSGPDSGASQPHRHVQFFPVPAERGKLPFDRSAAGDEGQEGEGDGEAWSHPRLPFLTFCIRYPKAVGVPEVVEAYETLLRRCEEARGKGCSYNMGITREWIALAPRISEDGGREGVGINGTVLAGEVMVKRDEDWEFFTERGGLEGVLKGIGIVADARI
ncbi:hypothetical protein BZA05DRAFT_386753 [Tricharina praecox]|uniref:uncharacterized protein n=1 Tax=Tricharina praecox TaxID=43433 RepID=UPI00221F4D7C|nr:uncharacterized protein BZA05DRAFT_386753 [Tricharina praecox]KAI5856947.1 hypothetical protein BZA05DRAFT_386753 [Tricharina praecox]